MKPVLVAILLLWRVQPLRHLQVGYLGIFAAGFANPGSLQVLLDLVVACLLISSWMVIDARANGRNPWPYVFITLVARLVRPAPVPAARGRARSGGRTRRGPARARDHALRMISAPSDPLRSSIFLVVEKSAGTYSLAGCALLPSGRRPMR